MADNEYEDLVGAEPAAEANEYVDLLNQQAAEQSGALRQSMFAASKTDPDRRAKAIGLSKKTGVPADIAERNPDMVAEAAAQDNDYYDLIRNSPKLAKWLESPDNSSVSHDDLENLKEHERALQDFGFQEWVGMIGKNFMGGMAGLGGFAARLPATAVDAALLIPNAINKPLGLQQYRSADWLMNNPAAKAADEARAWWATDESKDNAFDLYGAGNFKAANRALVAQVAANAPTTLGAIAAFFASGGTTAVVGVGAYAASEANKAARDAGADPATAGANALVHGAAEAYFEKIAPGSIGFLKKQAATIASRFGKQTAAQAMKDFAGTIMKAVAGEGSTEMLTEATQAFSDFITGVDPDALDNFGSRVANAGLVGAAAGGTFQAPAAIGKGVSDAREMARAENAKNLYLSMGATAEASKLRERLPEAHRQMVEEMTKDSPVENVYIPVEDFTEYFQTDETTAAAIAQELGISKELDEAVETGGDVKIPLAVWAEKMVGTDHYKALADSVKFSPQDMTPKQHKELKEQMQAEAAAQKEAQAQEEDKAQDSVVIADVAKQLEGIGIRPDEAKTYASLYRGFEVMGRREDVDPAELFRSFGLEIQREDGGTVEGKTYNQAELEAEELLSKHQEPAEIEVPAEQLATVESELTPLVEKAAQAKPSFDSSVAEIAKAVGGEAKLASVKDTKRAARKVVLDYFGMTSEIKDLLRASVVVKNVSEVQGALKAIGERFEITRVKDRFAKPTAAGYSDVLVNVKTPEGVAGEIQIHVPEMLAVKNLGHKLYNVERNLPEGHGDKARLQDVQKRLYAGALSRHSSTSAANSSSESGVPSTNALAALTNGLGSGTNATADLSGKMMTGTPSTSTLIPSGNVIDLTSKESVSKIATPVKADSVESGLTQGVYNDPGKQASSDAGGRGAGAGNRQGADVRPVQVDSAPIKGLPKSSPGAGLGVRKAAALYAAKAGFPFRQQARYAKADPERGARIAAAYDAMVHAPNDPEVKAAYRAMIDETLAQFQVIKEMGITIDAIEPGQANPYPEGSNQMIADVVNNKHIWFFPTDQGFGTVNAVNDNPLLEPTNEKVGERQLVANDVFRIVHDIFGHCKEGVGFGPHGEENAWNSHVRMYSPLAARAMTSETRGQNSWVNFGPYGEKNRKDPANTTYADQKSGLLPDWVWSEGLVEDAVFEQPSRGRIKFGKGKTLIQLLQGANQSTFLHETGHLYLEVLGDLASRPAPSVELAADYMTILDWLGVKSREEIQTKHHEKFAKAFEAYLMEGKAPSSSLRVAFAKFRAWLVSVYRELRGLNVTLTDDVRKVMDRMLATEDEIRQAEAEQEIAPMFADPAAAGLTPAEAENYQKAIAQARMSTEEELTSKVMDQVRREQKAWWKEQRSAIRAEVETEVNQRKEYIAISVLRDGKFPNGDKVERMKVSADAIVDLFSKERLKRLPKYVYTEKGGLHPNTVAEFLGYTSGSEMLWDIENAENKETLIDRNTDQSMKDLYGDMMADGTMAEEAMKAVHNTDRSDLLHKEMTILAQKRPGVYKNMIRKVARPMPTVKDIRSNAEEIIAKTKVRDVRPAVWLRAEAKAGKEALDAFLAGDLETALKIKRRQLLNHELYRAATNAQARVGKIVDYMKRFEKPATREKLGKAGPAYLQQVDAILDRFDFRRSVTLTEIDKRASLRDWLAEQAELGFSPEIPEHVLDEANRKHYKEASVEELAGISDSVKQIEHFARLKNKLLAAAKERELDAAIDEALASIEANSKGATPKEIETRLPQAELGRLFGGILASHRKAASLIRQMDGFKDGGIMWELLVRPMNKAGNDESVANSEATKALKEIFSAYTAKDIAKMYRKEFIPGAGVSLTKMGQLMVALNTGNEDNRTKLLEGYGWEEGQLKAITDRLDERDWKFVKDVWAFIDSYWAETKAMSERVNGVAPEKVEGNYFPLKYDDRQEPKAYRHLAEEAAKRAMRGASVQSTTKHGHRKERTEGVKMPVRLDFGVIFEHIGEVIHDQTHYEMLIDMNRLLGDRRLQGAITAHHGDQVYSQLRTVMEDVAAGHIPAQKSFEKAINWLRSGSSIAAMGWNLMTSLQQPLGLAQSFVRVGPKWVAKGISRWLGDAKRMESTVSWIHERSDFMAQRAKTQMREINEIRNQVTSSGRFSAVTDSYFWMINRMQMVADVPTWLGAYEKAMSEDVNEQRAYDLADQAVLDSQGGGQMKDLANIQRGGPMLKLWTNFYSYFNTTYNLNVEAVKKTDFKSPGDIGRLAVDMLMLNTVPALLGLAIKEAVRGGDDDDSFEKIVREQAGYLTGMLVGLREIGGVLQGYHGYEGPAGATFFADLGRFLKQAEQGEADEAFWRAANKVAGVLFHYPAGQVDRTVRGARALVDGDTERPLAPLVGPPKTQ